MASQSLEGSTLPASTQHKHHTSIGTPARSTESRCALLRAPSNKSWGFRVNGAIRQRYTGRDYSANLRTRQAGTEQAHHGDPPQNSVTSPWCSHCTRLYQQSSSSLKPTRELSPGKSRYQGSAGKSAGGGHWFQDCSLTFLT